MQNSISLEKGKPLSYVNLFYILVFAYFFTLSADLLNIKVLLYKVKLNHVISLALLGVLGLSEKAFFFPKKLVLSFSLIFISLSVSSLLGAHTSRCLGYLGVYLFDFIAYFLVPFNLIYQFKEEKILKLYFASFFAVGSYALFQLCISSFGITDPFATQKIGNLTRPNGFSYEPSFYALYMCGYVMFYNAYCILEKTTKKTLFLLLINAFLLLSTSTGGFFGYFIFFSVFLLICLKKPLKGLFPKAKKRLLNIFLSFGAFFVLFTSLFPYLTKQYFLKFFFMGFKHHSFYERWVSIVNSLKVFAENKWFGVGLGGVGPTIYGEKNGGMTFYSSLSLEELEIYDPKNVLTEILASLGLFGFLSFAILGWTFIRLFNLFLKTSSISKEDKKRGCGLFISLVTCIIVLQFNSGLFRSYIWVHAAITFAYLYKTMKYEERSS